MADHLIVLHWIPVGAGGNGVVTLSAWIYERVHAWRERRPATSLLHTALEVYANNSRTVIECAWPSPDSDTRSRGVVVEGPVFTGWLGRFRPFRYEVRCWPEGVIGDRAYATDVSEISDDPATVLQVLDSVTRIPPTTWGRDPGGIGEMWNSNSVIACILASAGIDVTELASTVTGRAPGLLAGVAAANRSGTGTPANRD